MTAEYPQGDEPLIPMAALSLPALRQVVAMVAPSRPPAGSTPPNAPSPTPTPRSGTGQSGKPRRSPRRPTARSRVAEWHWEPVTDDLLDGLPPAVLAAVRQVAGELTIRESIIFLDGREFTGEPPGLRTVQRGPLMLVYLTGVRGERVVFIKVSWIS